MSCFLEIIFNIERKIGLCECGELHQWTYMSMRRILSDPRNYKNGFWNKFAVKTPTNSQFFGNLFSCYLLFDIKYINLKGIPNDNFSLNLSRMGFQQLFFRVFMFFVLWDQTKKKRNFLDHIMMTNFEQKTFGCSN